MAAAATPTTTAATATTDAAGTTDAATTAAPAKKSFATLFTEAKQELKSGEKLVHVKGHQFGRIKGGERDDQCVNLSGNARTGKVFDLIWRDGRCFHVYDGAGADRVVVEVGGAAKKDPTPAKTDATDSGGGTSAA